MITYHLLIYIRFTVWHSEYGIRCLLGPCQLEDSDGAGKSTSTSRAMQASSSPVNGDMEACIYILPNGTPEYSTNWNFMGHTSVPRFSNLA